MTATKTSLPKSDHQFDAASPRNSVWVSASAGAGKTTVLVNRLLRLLLDGNRPEKILCITYTKSAAAEIIDRVVTSATQWAVADDKTIFQNLEKILGQTPSPQEIKYAKSLLPKILQAPGGMKIMTIHAFCQSVLSRFPLEAGINGNFKICDELQSIELLNQAKQELLSDNVEIDLQKALEFLYDKINEETQDSLISSLVKRRHKIETLGDPTIYRDQLFNLCGIESSFNKQTVIRSFMASIPSFDNLERYRDLLRTGKGASPQNVADNIQAYLDNPNADAYCDLFLTGKNTIHSRLLTGIPDDRSLIDFLEQEAERAYAFKQDMIRYDLATSSYSLFLCSVALLGRYQQLKQERNLLDYEDQILLTEKLLTELSDCQWVLYKLDAGIDHIMLDEAQDTSPSQWKIIDILATEFFSGLGAKDDLIRTLFVVGDEKQSIFSFQNADPAAFSAMRESLHSRANENSHLFNVVPLNKNYRSSAVILELVDKIFSDASLHAAVTHDQMPIAHTAHYETLPGKVDLWPLIPHDKTNKLKSVYTLAGSIADEVKRMVAQDHHHDGKPIRYGDIMILVRKRAPMVGPLVKAFKDRNIPVRSVDRQLLADSLAVQDCFAALSFCVNPFDDYTLSCFLKSPFIGLTEDDLYALCFNRTQTVWQNLQEDAKYKNVVDYCLFLLKQSTSNNPYRFLYELLTHACPADSRSGRHALIRRLGYDAYDLLDQFLDVAVTYQKDHNATNQHFLTWFLQSGATTKAQEASGQETHVRIMTAHASKGLQASIVFLADAHSKPQGYESKREVIWSRENDYFLWAMNPGKDHPLFEEAKDIFLKDSFDEYYRLLYVALTRARQHLVICGCEQARNLHKEYKTWYEIASDSISKLSHPSTEMPKGVIRYAKVPAEETAFIHVSDIQEEKSYPLPDYMLAKPAPEKWPYFPLRPSQLPGKEQPVYSPLTQTATGNIRRGDVLHKIFAALSRHPIEEQPHILNLLVRKYVRDENYYQSYYDEIWNVISDARFQKVFSDKARAEVPITGQITLNGNLYNVSGQIDRLLVTNDRVLIVDFKTNRPASRRQEDVSENYIFQMQAYKMILQNIYPNKKIETAILWTSVPYLLPLSL